MIDASFSKPQQRIKYRMASDNPVRGISLARGGGGGVGSDDISAAAAAILHFQPE
jgi:hypothetical protein